jgi:hypothetical protein
MTDARLAYDDPSTPAELDADCRAAQAALTGPLRVAARELGREQPKRADLDVPLAAARIAAAMHLQVDAD